MAMELLSGVKVLDFTAAFVGPFCSRIMADMGAEVIKIERPMENQPDRFTAESLPTHDGVPYLHLNGGKKSLCVDLKDPRGLDIVRSLVKGADVFVENFTPHVVRSYGLDYANLRAMNPGIIMCSMTGYGQEGFSHNPRACLYRPHRPSHEWTELDHWRARRRTLYHRRRHRGHYHWHDRSTGRGICPVSPPKDRRGPIY